MNDPTEALVARLASVDSVVEVGVGNRPDVAAALAERGVDVTATDIYERRVPDGVADVYVRVHNDDGEVLHAEGDGRPRVPRCVGTSAKPLVDRARTAVEEATGVSCVIDEIVRVTIAGVRNAENPDADTVYRLLVLFDATYDSGQAQNGVWQSDSEIPEFV